MFCFFFDNYVDFTLDSLSPSPSQGSHFDKTGLTPLCLQVLQTESAYVVSLGGDKTSRSLTAGLSVETTRLLKTEKLLSKGCWDALLYPWLS